MSIKDKNTLKGFFNYVDQASNANFEDLIESAYNQVDDSHKLGAKNYDSSKTYDVGDTCLYNDGSGFKFYRANNTTTGIFNPSNWDLIIGGGSVPTLTNSSVVFWNGGTLSQDNANFNYASNLLRLQGSAVGDFNSLSVRNNASATLNNSASVSFWANRTTGGMTNLGGIRGIITNIGNTTYSSAVSLFATPTNGSPLEVLRATSVASAVNYLAIGNSATGVAVPITAAGTDTNIALQLSAKGNGSLVLSTANGTIQLGAGTGNILLNNSGNVYIGGSTTPTARLHVGAGGIGIPNIQLVTQSDVTSNLSNGMLWFTDPDFRFRGNVLMKRGAAANIGTLDNFNLNLVQNNTRIATINSSNGISQDGSIFDVTVNPTVPSGSANHNLNTNVADALTFRDNATNNLLRISTTTNQQSVNILTQLRISGGLSGSTSSITTNITLDRSYFIIYLNATSNNITATLPDLSNTANGELIFVIKRVDNTSNTVKIVGFNAAQTLDDVSGSIGKTLSYNESVMINAVGLVWKLH